MGRKNKGKTPCYTAKTADKHVLYQEAVQSVDVEVEFLSRVFQKCRGRKPVVLREDFCGTAALACAWVKRHKHFKAIGVDLHQPTLRWAEKHNLSKLTPSQRSRITLVHANVLTAETPRVDVLAAFNYSYFVLKTRTLLGEYFKRCRRALKRDGMMFLDAYGGSEALLEKKEKRSCKGFKYVWEHARYNPITAETLCYIHFRFPDGSKMNRAFRYDWRLWTLPEIRELLQDAGFRHVDVYWEGTDRDTGEGDGVYRRRTRGEAIESWLCYLIARC